MTRTRTVITALSCLSVLALGACSDDDPEPKLAPTPSSSVPTTPSTTAASGPTEPTMPAAAEALDRGGAAQFVEYWFETVSYAVKTGDTDAMAATSAPACKSCVALMTKIKDLYGKGGRIDSAGWTVETSTVEGDFQSDKTALLLRVRESKQTLYEGERIVDQTPMLKVTMRITLSGLTDHWLVDRLEIFR